MGRSERIKMKKLFKIIILSLAIGAMLVGCGHSMAIKELLEQGMQAYESGTYSLAFESFEKVLEYDSDNAEAKIMYGKVAEKLDSQYADEIRAAAIVAITDPSYVVSSDYDMFLLDNKIEVTQIHNDTFNKHFCLVLGIDSNSEIASKLVSPDATGKIYLQMVSNSVEVYIDGTDIVAK